MSELLIKSIDQALDNISKEFPVKSDEGASEMMIALIKISRHPEFRQNAKRDDKAFFSVLLIDFAMIYGQLQFEAGVEAARQSIVSDNPVPPQFVP